MPAVRHRLEHFSTTSVCWLLVVNRRHSRISDGGATSQVIRNYYESLRRSFNSSHQTSTPFSATGHPIWMRFPPSDYPRLMLFNIKRLLKNRGHLGALARRVGVYQFLDRFDVGLGLFSEPTRPRGATHNFCGNVGMAVIWCRSAKTAPWLLWYRRLRVDRRNEEKK